MPGSDAVVGLPEDGTALEYDMPNYAAPVEAEDQVWARRTRTGLLEAKKSLDTARAGRMLRLFFYVMLLASRASPTCRMFCSLMTRKRE